MKRLSKIIGLNREAILFDSRLYIVKAILAIATGYLIGKAMPLTRLDMISVLLGVMYNLEPINILGIKGGLSQLVASTLGAACTGILIVFFGINVVTISVSMALTLLVSLKLNWRMVSPVAIFTCIYMTQYVQKDALGNPSIWLTYKLRIAALGLGVLIAILYNYLFSFLYYRKIAYKRLQFAKEQVLNGLTYTYKQLEGGNEKQGEDYISVFPSIFNDVDLIYSNISLMINESAYSFGILASERLKVIQKVLRYFRDINHLAYDINFINSRGNHDSEFDKNGLREIKSCIYALEKLDFTLNEHNTGFESGSETTSACTDTRINSNIKSIRSFTGLVLEESKNL